MRKVLAVGLGVVALATVASGCTASPAADHSSTTRPTATSPTGPVAANAPTLVAAAYTDVPSGQPGYALIVNPGPMGSGILGGLAVFQYQDGKEAAYFSFSGRAISSAPFSLSLKGEPRSTTATATVTAQPNSSITIDDCSTLFSPVFGTAAFGDNQPPAPASCTFTYKVAPGPARTQPTVVTNLVADAATKSGLLDAFLTDHGWQTQYASEISLTPGATYVAYDPNTGLDWSEATFSYSGPASGAANSPDVAMQDGGDKGIFYKIPVAAAPPGNSGWTLVQFVGIPFCYSGTVLPAVVITTWGLTDSPNCK